MAVAALEIRGDVAGGFAGGLHAVVANDAVAGDGQRDLGVVDRLGRIPAHHRVAGRAVLAGGRMIRSLALRNGAVVTADAAAHHLRVIEVHVRPERDRVVAGGAVIRGGNVVSRLRRRIEGRALDVAGTAISRRSLENRIEVAALARQIAVHALELEPGRQVIERNRDRRRFGGCGELRRPEREQQHERRQGERTRYVR